MADVELVIKIPKELYEIIKNPKKLETMYHAGKVCEAVRNGKRLPKGHGELIDRQSLKLSFFTLSRFYKTWNLGKNKIMGEIENAQTIIGASKENE